MEILGSVHPALSSTSSLALGALGRSPVASPLSLSPAPGLASGAWWERFTSGQRSTATAPLVFPMTASSAGLHNSSVLGSPPILFQPIPPWIATLTGGKASAFPSFASAQRLSFESLSAIGTLEFSENLARMMRERENHFASARAISPALESSSGNLLNNVFGPRTSRSNTIEELNYPPQSGAHQSQLPPPIQYSSPSRFEDAGPASETRKRNATSETRMVPYEERPGFKKQEQRFQTKSKLKSAIQFLLSRAGISLLRMSRA